MGYLTKQKKAVALFFEQNADQHLTAEQVISGLQSEGTISKATVYRTLDSLEKEGKLRKFNIDAKTGACYQLADNCGENVHFHLKCSDCGKLFHVECQRLSEMERHISEEHSFLIDYGKTVFYGQCRDCALKQDNQTR